MNTVIVTSSKELMNASIQPETTPGRISGSVTRRKTGKTQTVPVIYIEDGGRYVVAAAYSGSDTDPSWWLNLQANPVAVVQVMVANTRRTLRIPS